MSSAVIQVGVPTGFRPKAPHLHRKAIAQARVHSRRNSPACFHPVVSGTNRHFNSRKRIENRASMGRIGSLPTVRGTLAWKQMQPKEGGHACSKSAISSSWWERSWTLAVAPCPLRFDRIGDHSHVRRATPSPCIPTCALSGNASARKTGKSTLSNSRFRSRNDKLCLCR